MKEPASGPELLVVEDDRAAREGLQALIDGTPGFSCVAACRSVEEALKVRPPEPPDVILLDVELPGMSGAQSVRPLRERFHPAPIVMLTVFEEPERVFESICNGALGYLLKTTPAKLLESIAEVRNGGAPMSPEIARQVVRLFQRIAPPVDVEHHLTPQQETRLVALLAEGYSYQGRGRSDDTCLSVNTVRNYIRFIYDKLHVHTKSEAVSKAIKARSLS